MSKAVNMAIKKAGKLLLAKRMDIPGPVDGRSGFAPGLVWGSSMFYKRPRATFLNDGRSLLTRSPQHDVIE
jgi:hypothetical protein